MGEVMTEGEKVAQREAIVAALGDGHDYEDGVILEWTRTFGSGSLVYTYSAVKAVGAWWMSGQAAGTALPWDALVADYLRYAQDGVWMMTRAVRIA